MARFPKPPKNQKTYPGKPSGPTPGKKAAEHGTSSGSRLGMGAKRSKPKGK